MRISCVSPLHSTLSSRSLAACVCRKQQASLLEQDPTVFRWKHSLVFCTVQEIFALFFLLRAFARTSTRKFTVQLCNFVWSGNFLQMHLRGEITRNCHALSTSPNTLDMVSHERKTYLSCRLYLQALTEKQGKGIDCNGSSLFSIPSFLRILDIVSDSRWCWQISWIIVQFIRISSSMLTIKNVALNTHILSCISRHSNFAAGLSRIRSNKTLMKNVGMSQLLRKSQS